MKKTALFTGICLLALSAGFIGCGKKGGGTGGKEAAATAAEVAGLPGSAEVMAAIEKKDYEAALSALGKLKAEATPEQQPLVGVLSHNVKMKLLELEAADPKAAEALSALRAMTTGR